LRPLPETSGRGQGRIAAVLSAFAGVALAMIALAAFLPKWGTVGKKINSGSIVHASEATLPVLNCADPVYYRDNDGVLAGIDIAAANYYADYRAKCGLGSAAESEALSTAALYGALSALCQRDGNGNTASGQNGANAAQRAAETAVQAAIGSISGINGFEVYFATGYACTDAASGARLALRSILNTYSGGQTLSRSNIACFGVASAVRETAQGLEYCFVWCYGKTALTTAAETALNAKFPAAPCVSGELPASPAEGETLGEVYVLKGKALTAAAIAEALELRDLRGVPVTVRFDAAAVDTKHVGTQDVNISLTFGGRIAGYPLTVNISDAAPLILDEPLTLPEIPDGEYWNPAYYAAFDSGAGKADVVCVPAALSAESLAVSDAGEGGETPQQTVKLIVRNALGKTATRTLTATVSSAEYIPVRPAYTDNNGLNVLTPAGGPLRQNGHSLIQWSGKPGSGSGANAATSGKSYVFTLLLPDGRTLAVTKTSPVLVWNPAQEGLYTLTVTEIDAGGSISDRAQIKIDVAKAGEMVYNEPEVRLGDSSSWTLAESGEGIMLLRGVKPGTTAAELLGVISCAGGAEPELTVTLPDGGEPGAEQALPTGARVVLTDRGVVYADWHVIVSGDVNGDGKVGIADFAKLRQHLLKGGVITGDFEYAADVNGDSKIGIGDFAKLRQYLLGKIELD
jgi:hypothetical protein